MQMENREVTVFESVARTATAQSAVQNNRYAKGLALLIDVTAVSGGSVTQVEIQLAFGPVNAMGVTGTNLLTVYTIGSLTLNAVARYGFLVYPGASAAGNWTAAPVQGVVPRSWALKLTHANGSSITYSAIASYVL